MIVIIDNYDSFTYNLVQYFKQMDEEVVVFRNDEVTLAEIMVKSPDLIVLSPGPGKPEESGICKKVLQHFYTSIPILGVCLGHQLIVEYFGGSVQEGKQPMHGKVTMITHDGRCIFRGVPNPVQVTRYHSFQTPFEDIPICLEISAMSEDSVVMGVRHHSYPVEGIQFHPESILTECGFQMTENAYRRALCFMEKKRGRVRT